jgi:hypothetical protein
VVDDQISASVDGAVLLQIKDENRPLTGGGIALLCEEGRIGADTVSVRPSIASNMHL